MVTSTSATAKSIILNFGLAEKYNRPCNLRFDDTNPTTEDTHFVDSIIRDIEWLGYKPVNIFYTSDYFDFLYNCALTLIKKGIS
jgi:glutaminyl-tRNA synthetase